MKIGNFIIFFGILLLSLNGYADMPEGKGSTPLENELPENQIAKRNLILVDQNNFQLNSDSQYHQVIVNSEKKMYELSLVIEKQREMLGRLEAQHEELKRETN
jgi:hypothetical protein